MSNSLGQQTKPLTLVAGLGITGVSVVRHLLARGHRLRVVDSRYAPPGLQDLADLNGDVEVHTGHLSPDALAGATTLVLSPGLAADIPLAQAAREQNIDVIGDIELFAREAPCPVIGISGSNGKSTVTALVAELARSIGVSARSGGNLGPAALELLAEPELALAVLELSSFQLETTQTLKPVAGALLNISPDHLDRHGSLERYAAIKGRLLEAADVAVYNRDDRLVAELAASHPDRMSFGLTPPGAADEFGIVRDNNTVYLARGKERILSVAELTLRGAHNWANALAALALLAAAGFDFRAALPALTRFPGLPHRCQWLADVAGVTYINDSKATNPGSAIAAIQGFGAPLVLIAGGQSKATDFKGLAEAAAKQVRTACVYGEAAAELGAALAGHVPVSRYDDFDAAVRAAAGAARAGEVVLLSPACSSLDAFSSYVERGERFAALVAELST